MARRRSPTIVTWLAAALLGGWLLCLTMIFIWSQRDTRGDADAIVVLGAAQYGGRPSPVLQARLDHALGLWKEKHTKRVVLTGGRRDGDRVSEAVAGRRYLTRRGVPAGAILLEPTGRTSLASMIGAAGLLRARPDSFPARPRVLIVSDPFHMLRLDVIARLQGWQPMVSPTRTSPISANRAKSVEYMLRESIALPADVALVLYLKITGRDASGVGVR